MSDDWSPDPDWPDDDARRWQPIDTVPDNAEPRLLLDEDGRMLCGWRCGDKWLLVTQDGEPIEVVRPTFWMELPELPPPSVDTRRTGIPVIDWQRLYRS